MCESSVEKWDKYTSQINNNSYRIQKTAYKGMYHVCKHEDYIRY